MDKSKGFMKYKRVEPQKINPQERLTSYSEQVLPTDTKILQEQAARCMDCSIPFCQSGMKLNHKTTGCPLHNYIPEWNELVFQSRWHEAYLRLIATNPFPEFTSRVCPAPCEGACTNNVYEDAVTIKDIEKEIIDYAFKHNYVKPLHVKNKKTRIAIIGSGPSGLSAAYYLRSYGYQITVFEKEDTPGGLLMYGIPSMKLEKDTVSRRIKLLEESGIVFQTNKELGKTIHLDQLEEEFDYIVLAIGSEIPRDIQVDNREFKEIIFAMDYLKEATKSRLSKRENNLDAQEKNVVIIGGGDTATDCVATALRQACKSVVQLEILPKKPDERQNNPWPEYPIVHKVDYGQEEAISLTNKDPRQYETLITSCNGLNKLTSITTSKIKWIKKNNRYTFEKVPNSEVELPADMVIIAAGFVSTDSDLLTKMNIHLHKNQFITNHDKVLICGDAKTGQSLVVQALEEGKQLAYTLHNQIISTQ